MKGKLNPTIVVVIIFLLVFSGGLWAQQKAQKVQKPVVVPHTAVRIPWDLAVVDIVIEPSCRAVAVIKNTGTVALPDWAYGYESSGKYVLLHVGKEGGSSTGVYLWALDSAKVLQTPGGELTYGFAFTNDQPCILWGHIDVTNKLPEVNETNNKLTKRFGPCPYFLPDLKVDDIRLINGCKIEVTLRNSGKAGVPDSYYELPNAVAVQMYKGGQPWGGMILKLFDPTGKLKIAGNFVKHVWFPKATNLNLTAGWHSIKVVVDPGNVLTELDETNNHLTKRVNCLLRRKR